MEFVHLHKTGEGWDTQGSHGLIEAEYAGETWKKPNLRLDLNVADTTLWLRLMGKGRKDTNFGRIPA
jgi:hypothetical protein